MKRAKGHLGAQSQLVSKKNAHDHGDGFEQPRQIVVKKADDASDMVNISNNEEPLSPVACVISDEFFDSYMFAIVGFKKEIDVESLKILLQNNLVKHQRFSSVVTLSDVIMGVLSAGLLRYMNRRQNEQRLRLNMRLRAMVAVNMRPFAMLKDLDRNMKNPSKAMWRNKLGFWLFPLPTFHYGDPLQYCPDTRMMSRRKKLSSEASLSHALLKCMPTKLVAHLSSILCRRSTLGFSNVTGPMEEIQLSDNPITHIIPTVHINYSSIVIHFMSYAGKGKLVALVSEDVIPNPQQLCEDCADALQEAAAKTTPRNLS
ncbi:wax ester synthase/diacylglycerol acyltransferase 11 isoform X4 [Cryptomeria japonica]|uniref:wax ester synthase/diacylglycerol acyltransferase 11 isoform X4 n=1 Tax=Cryptomeria japonica TaxID=3369 RepID=UPI0027DA1D32|nr:wax ester synthase/diacylglycerol acyltransferase 11 isoform X4 [Cryptomeria japonica]